MTINAIRQALIKDGRDPDDFSIVINGNGYSVTPKWFYETKKIAKKEDKPIKEDVTEIAELTAYALEDTTMAAQLTAILLEDSSTTGELLAYALEKIAELETKIEQLQGGNA